MAGRMALESKGLTEGLKQSFFSVVEQPLQQQRQELSPPPSSLSSAPITLEQIQNLLAVQFEQVITKLREELRLQRIEGTSQNVVFKTQGVAMDAGHLEEHTEEVIQKEGMKTEKVVEVIYSEMIQSDMEYNEKDYAARPSGLKENKQEKLLEERADVVASMVNSNPNIMLGKNENTYRVNSRVAFQRILPRDVALYFFRKSHRNESIQAFYKQRFQIAIQDVMILKEIFVNILRGKGFVFLTFKFKDKKGFFKGNIFVGSEARHVGFCHKWNIFQEVKVFYPKVLKVKNLPSYHSRGMKDQAKQMGVVVTV